MKRQAWEIISLSNHIDRVMQQGVMIKSKTSKNLLSPREVNQANVNMSKDNLEPLNFSELMDESNSQMNESNAQSWDSAKSTLADDDEAFEEAMKTVKDKVERLVQIGKEMARKTAVLEKKVENLEEGRLMPHDIQPTSPDTPQQIKSERY